MRTTIGRILMTVALAAPLALVTGCEELNDAIANAGDGVNAPIGQPEAGFASKDVILGRFMYFPPPRRR